MEILLWIIAELYENTGKWIYRTNRQKECRETRIQRTVDAPGLAGKARRTNCARSPGSSAGAGAGPGPSAGADEGPSSPAGADEGPGRTSDGQRRLLDLSAAGQASLGLRRIQRLVTGG